MLDMARLAAQQHPALTPQRAQHAHLLGRAKRPAQQTVCHELLDPLAIQHVGLAPRDVLDMTRIDQHDRETTRLQQFEHSNPVHAGRFHCDSVDPAGLEPVGHGVEVRRETGKFAHRFIVAIRRYRHKVGRAADVDAGGIGMGNRQCCCPGLARLKTVAGIALGQGLLHHSVAGMAPHRVHVVSSLS
ncbi:hypothetical protein R69658_08256 [Paraburkholderia aspalathi]|uniref:Uncharacterized protein n=1 Tax=Paraburkholderia aspalathi TaxID=1324617 RepID=A0ABM8T9Z1_9BURK|nr:hypothetical protein R69658_08256 [Paraburkholderia aspalathi]